MSDRSDKLAIQKKLIRCVALTDKDGFTMTTLVKAYKQFENKECPFREMGYQSFEQFLRSMPDVIEFREVDGKEVIFGVPDQYTEHVTKMVSNSGGSGAPLKSGTAACSVIYRGVRVLFLAGGCFILFPLICFPHPRHRYQ